MWVITKNREIAEHVGVNFIPLEWIWAAKKLRNTYTLTNPKVSYLFVFQVSGFFEKYSAKFYIKILVILHCVVNTINK